MQATKNSTNKMKGTWLNFIKGTIADVIPEVSSLHEIKHQVQRITILKGKVHINHEGRIELR